MASARVATSERKRPRTDEVTVTVPGFFTPAHRHAQVLGLDDDEHAAGRQDRGDGVGDLRRHALLHLQPAGEAVDQAGQLGQAGDAAVLGRDVGDVGLAEERHQVVLAQRGERDVAHHHHLVVLGREGDLQVAGGVVVQAGEELLVHGGHAVGGGQQAVAAGVLPDGAEQLGHGRPHPFDVDAHCFRSLVAVDAAQVPVALGHVEAVADHELGRDGEADVAQVEVDPLLALLDQQRADLHALGLAGREVAPQVVERQAAVDDVLDDQHVAALELGVEVLDDAHHARRLRGAAVGGHGHEVDVDRQGDGPAEVAHEEHGALEHGDQQRRLRRRSRRVICRAELGHPRPPGARRRPARARRRPRPRTGRPLRPRRGSPA